MHDDERVLIILPIPNPVLSPNHAIGSIRGRYMKAASTKRHRAMAATAITEQFAGGSKWEFSTVEATMFFRTKRRRDDDNNTGWLKAYYDGIVDAGLVVDDDSVHMRKHVPAVRVDEESPRVEMVIARVEHL